jgi:hypothetical protein
MKKLKLKLDELKVQSFVTELNPGLAQTAKGGDDDGGYGTDSDLCDIIKTIVGPVLTASAASNWPCRKACGGTGTKTGTKPPSTQPPGGGNPGSTPGV